ncbi:MULTISPECIES: tetratricopeptide repeat protein [Bacillus]|uniref:tetratricopeptide repeat protein n=1 Tax=Bacillus TaxID=1386 RepID=UPI0002D60808|nr:MULTISPECIES: tetratricopeptide repeat protein [Bacillus]
MGKDSKFCQTAKIFSFHPTGEYYYNKGLKAYHQQDLYKAKKYLERAQELEPLEPMIACQLAIVCTDLGEYTHSNTILDNIITNLDPYMYECHYFLANNYAHLGMFKETYKHAHEYLRKEIDGQFVDDAEDLLDLITFENNESEESLFEQDSLINEQEKARELLEAGKYESAIEVLNATIKDHPEFWFAYNNLALAHFYLGDHERAFSTLYEVLEKNPGNLHALCNLAVFYHLEKEEDNVQELIKALKKVRPILSEQQYKLGATFALIGEYEWAYIWLKQLEKVGYDGDDTFYYWLSTCAHQLGLERSAKRAWKKVLEQNPAKEGLEPWGEIISNIDGYEQQTPMILHKLQSESKVERLFGLFLLKHSPQKKKIEQHPIIKLNSLMDLEKSYLHLICHNQLEDQFVSDMDEVAEQLFNHYQPITHKEEELYKLMFSLCIEALNKEIPLTNSKAWAAACDYAWGRNLEQPFTQKEIADKYNISLSSLRKYVNSVNNLL